MSTLRAEWLFHQHVRYSYAPGPSLLRPWEHALKRLLSYVTCDQRLSERLRQAFGDENGAPKGFLRGRRGAREAQGELLRRGGGHGAGHL